MFSGLPTFGKHAVKNVSVTIFSCLANALDLHHPTLVLHIKWVLKYSSHPVIVNLATEEHKFWIASRRNSFPSGFMCGFNGWNWGSRGHAGILWTFHCCPVSVTNTRKDCGQKMVKSKVSFTDSIKMNGLTCSTLDN